ncbi:Ham1 family protein [Perkinsela sp. CCAP 1560/4]|nr:Ham1 family protein [Perkinsela sp. CCAP 1560/4]|eukprot:KNH07142.1 Ham1 family protein [Perkinsela sp. CCAP 1560/4]
MDSCIIVTGNENKWLEIKEILSTYFQVERKAVEILECQGTLEEIAREKACAAYKILGKPCLVEDVSLELGALGNFPGPYVKHFLSKVSLEDINRLADTFENRKITAHCMFALAKSTDPHECEIFHGSVEGSIVPPRGNNGFGFDPIFEITHDSSRLTLAELSTKAKNSVSHRGRALEKVKEFFERRARNRS